MLKAQFIHSPEVENDMLYNEKTLTKAPVVSRAVRNGTGVPVGIGGWGAQYSKRKGLCQEVATLQLRPKKYKWHVVFKRWQTDPKLTAIICHP